MVLILPIVLVLILTLTLVLILTLVLVLIIVLILTLALILILTAFWLYTCLQLIKIRDRFSEEALGILLYLFLGTSKIKFGVSKTKNREKIWETEQTIHLNSK